MPKPRIGVVGCGVMGQSHMAILQRQDQAELCGVADPTPAAALQGQRFGVPSYLSLEDLIHGQRPDAIVLATPNPLHVPQALHCLQAGLAVLVEKPVATSVQEATDLVQAVHRLDGRLLVGHHRAHSPIMAAAKQVVSSGQLGRLVAVSGSACFYKPDSYFDAAWRKQVGAGPILINLIHDIHNLRLLCGEITAVQALRSSAVREFEVEDTAVINLRFSSGALGSFVLTDTGASARSWEQTSQENPVYPTYPDEDCYVLTGTRGTLSIPTMRLKKYPEDRQASWHQAFDCTQVEHTLSDPLQRQMAHFVRVIQAAEAPLVSAADGLANLRVTEAIVQAAQSGQTVEVLHD